MFSQNCTQGRKRESQWGFPEECLPLVLASLLEEAWVSSGKWLAGRAVQMAILKEMGLLEGL